MRIKITLSANKSGTIGFNYQHQIQAIIYGFLAGSDPNYSLWLHEQGFVYKKDKRFKLFVFSGIIFHGAIKTTPPVPLFNKEGERGGVNGFAFQVTQSNPFTLSFQIASPVNQFIQHLIDGIFKEGQEITLGREQLNVHRVETLQPMLPLPDGERVGVRGDISISLCPLESPIFVKKPMPVRERDKYLFPGDEEYENLLNQNLIEKYETLYGKQYKGEPLKFEFKIPQSQIPSPRMGDSQSSTPSPLVGEGRGEGHAKIKLVKSFKVFKNGKITGEIKGTLQPFTVTGSEELIGIGLDCGFGQLNSMGCGYVEAVKK